MKVCVFGAGAIGCHIAARMSAAKAAEVSVIARGRSLEAIRANGVVLKSGGKEVRGKPIAVTDDSSTLPKQDAVIVALKAHAVPSLAAEMEKLLAPLGVAVFMLNGLPWWWNQGRSGSAASLPLLDPQGELWKRLRERTLGCVLYSPNEIVSPGVVEHIGGNRFVIGEPSNENTQRLQAVIDAFSKSDLPTEAAKDLRAEIWRKLIGNAAGNSLAALTRLGHYALATDVGVRTVAVGIMRETLDVAAALGWDLRSEIDPEKLATRAQPGPSSTPSMLQDILLLRPVEVEAHLGQTQAFARDKRVSTPTIDIVLPLLRGLDKAQRALSAQT
jgi:2-dehydropantoate 2-reductase